jgi:hypothetical protein
MPLMVMPFHHSFSGFLNQSSDKRVRCTFKNTCQFCIDIIFVINCDRIFVKTGNGNIADFDITHYYAITTNCTTS